MKVVVADASAAAGTTVSVPISASGGPKLAAARVVLSYNPEVLEVESVEKGASLNDGEAQSGFTINDPGRVTMNFISVDGVVADKELFVVNFTVKAESGATSDLKLDKVMAWRADNRVDVLSDTQDGKFTVETGLPLPLPWLVAAIAGGLIFLLLAVFVLRGRSASPKSAGSATTACPQCGHANSFDTKFCGECGSAVK
jgi:hypothetical protein